MKNNNKLCYNIIDRITLSYGEFMKKKLVVFY